VRCSVQTSFLDRHPRTGSKPRDEYRIPASELQALNDALVGPIVVLR